MTARLESITTDDGWPVTITRFASDGPARATLLVAGATVVPQRFYRRFAEHAASGGYDVVTVDYRGVGASAPETLREVDIDFLDWARDLDAVLAHLGDVGPIAWVGHSFGGHALGLIAEPERVGAAYLFGTGAAWHGWMPRGESIRVRLLWRVVGPVLLRRHGHLPARWFGGGADTSSRMWYQWREWARRPHYFFDGPDGPRMRELFGRVTAPIASATATDDRWATPASRDAFATGFRSAPVERIDLDPVDRGLDAIGHMGYFRPASRVLWDRALDWLDDRVGRAS